MKTFQHFTSEAYYRRAHRGTDYHGRDYGGTPQDHEDAMRRNKAAASLQGGWLEREKKEKEKENK